MSSNWPAYTSASRQEVYPKDIRGKAAKHGLIDKHVYAMGGMTLDNIHIAKELGFGGVVICGDIWNRFDIHNQNDYRELISHFSKLRKATE